MKIKTRVEQIYRMVLGFFKKCNDDHVGAFAAMSAFYIFLSIIPFLIFLLTLTKYAPFSKNDIIRFLTTTLSFEKESLISGLVNEIYAKTGTTVFTISIVTALWSASRGFYAVVRGFDSVYDIDDTRNYFIIRLESIFWTIVLAIVIMIMLFIWVFGGTIYKLAESLLPILVEIRGYMMYGRIMLTIMVLTVVFLILYRFIPDRKSTFKEQLPGALLSAVAWVAVSWVSAFFVENFTNFSFIYGSMAGIMILMLWFNFCMLFVFYGAEFNCFIESYKKEHCNGNTDAQDRIS